MCRLDNFWKFIFWTYLLSIQRPAHLFVPSHVVHPLVGPLSKKTQRSYFFLTHEDVGLSQSPEFWTHATWLALPHTKLS